MKKTCLFCKHFVFICGDHGYSEYTPGNDASLSCMKDIWEIDMYRDYTDDFRKALLNAQDCEHFVLASMPWLDEPLELE